MHGTRLELKNEGGEGAPFRKTWSNDPEEKGVLNSARVSRKAIRVRSLTGERIPRGRGREVRGRGINRLEPERAARRREDSPASLLRRRGAALRLRGDRNVRTNA